ncbi:hypothetical protein GCM10010405_59810 [Streptomyces macrosporus]|uniref:Uncharacterized protein n=1 Tax=Streptomyces macrosporus TaxID=44032 RepID=A0ABN3KN76_9ACTN
MATTALLVVSISTASTVRAAINTGDGCGPSDGRLRPCRGQRPPGADVRRRNNGNGTGGNPNPTPATAPLPRVRSGARAPGEGENNGDDSENDGAS